MALKFLSDCIRCCSHCLLQPIQHILQQRRFFSIRHPSSIHEKLEANASIFQDDSRIKNKKYCLAEKPFRKMKEKKSFCPEIIWIYWLCRCFCFFLWLLVPPEKTSALFKNFATDADALRRGKLGRWGKKKKKRIPFLSLSYSRKKISDALGGGGMSSIENSVSFYFWFLSAWKCIIHKKMGERPGTS